MNSTTESEKNASAPEVPHPNTKRTKKAQPATKAAALRDMKTPTLSFSWKPGVVGRRAQHHAFDRTGHVGICLSDQLCQSEVEQFHRTAFGDHDVPGLQIAVDDAFAVRRSECFGDLLCVVESSLKRERSLKRLALDEFHHQRSIFDAVNLRDIRVVERRQHLCFAPEAYHAIRRRGRTPLCRRRPGGGGRRAAAARGEGLKSDGAASDQALRRL